MEPHCFRDSSLGQLQKSDQKHRCRPSTARRPVAHCEGTSAVRTRPEGFGLGFRVMVIVRVTANRAPASSTVLMSPWSRPSSLRWPVQMCVAISLALMATPRLCSNRVCVALGNTNLRAELLQLFKRWSADEGKSGTVCVQIVPGHVALRGDLRRRPAVALSFNIAVLAAAHRFARFGLHCSAHQAWHSVLHLASFSARNWCIRKGSGGDAGLRKDTRTHFVVPSWHSSLRRWNGWLSMMSRSAPPDSTFCPCTGSCTSGTAQVRVGTIGAGSWARLGLAEDQPKPTMACVLASAQQHVTTACSARNLGGNEISSEAMRKFPRLCTSARQCWTPAPHNLSLVHIGNFQGTSGGNRE